MTTITSQQYWESYYAKHRKPAPPSPFASFVLPFLKPGKRLLEIGCGNGRDSLHFANHGINVRALDQCKQELEYLNVEYDDHDHIAFLPGDMAQLPTGLGSLDYVYSRFSIHSIDKETEDKVFSWAAKAIAPGGLFFIEVRSVNDELAGQGEKVGENEYRTDHYRRFIVLEEIEALAREKGFAVLYSLESQGLAVYKDEDPAVIRLVLQR